MAKHLKPYKEPAPVVKRRFIVTADGYAELSGDRTAADMARRLGLEVQKARRTLSVERARDLVGNARLEPMFASRQAGIRVGLLRRRWYKERKTDAENDLITAYLDVQAGGRTAKKLVR